MLEQTPIDSSEHESRKKRGKQNRAAGARFELKVRKHFEQQGWTVSKWMNIIDLEQKKVVPAKRTFNPFRKALVIGTGFPDFIAFRPTSTGHEVIGVEVKTNGYLDAKEKAQARILLEQKIFTKFIVAKRGNLRGKIELQEILKAVPPNHVADLEV